MSKQIEMVSVPEIAGGEQVEVLEVLVKPGDQVEPEDALITLESEKASMDITASTAGIVKEIKVVAGDKLSSGDPVLILENTDPAAANAGHTSSNQQSTTTDHASVMTGAGKPARPAENAIADTIKAESENLPNKKAVETSKPSVLVEPSSLTPSGNPGTVYASPLVRRLAYELDINLNDITASGAKQRITKQDIHQHIKSRMNSTGAAGGATPWPFSNPPAVDFSQFGGIETQPLKKIKKISGKRLHQNWVNVPHVTQFGEADITELEAFRQREKQSALSRGVRLTPLVFIMKAVVAALQQFPQFNSSLSADGEQLILKKYFHIGVAVDTPNGLVVPVIRDVDKKGLFALAQELMAVSEQAREKGLSPAQMQGGCFSISSLGGIGGTAFTPIINAPEVAILGVAKSSTKPVYQQNEFQARLLLPLALSYDHRVIDGAEAARFMVYLEQCLSDLPKVLL